MRKNLISLIGFWILVPGALVLWNNYPIYQEQSMSVSRLGFLLGTKYLSNYYAIERTVFVSVIGVISGIILLSYGALSKEDTSKVVIQTAPMQNKSNSIFCSKCGRENSERSQFCINCGNYLGKK